jgi:predicted RNase H-like nuclease (RuvC/YqgF family)
MGIEALEKTVDRHEEEIKGLSFKVTENSTSMKFFQRTVEKFEMFTDECTKTLVGIQNSIQNLNDKHASLEKKLCEVKDKVDKNENLNTIDLRELNKTNKKGIMEKITYISTPIILLAFLIYLIFFFGK